MRKSIVCLAGIVLVAVVLPNTAFASGPTNFDQERRLRKAGRANRQLRGVQHRPDLQALDRDRCVAAT